jgi:hypothetical protein
LRIPAQGIEDAGRSGGFLRAAYGAPRSHGGREQAESQARSPGTDDEP